VQPYYTWAAKDGNCYYGTKESTGSTAGYKYHTHIRLEISG
jgi:hypothetical protein